MILLEVIMTPARLLRAAPLLLLVACSGGGNTSAASASATGETTGTSGTTGGTDTGSGTDTDATTGDSMEACFGDLSGQPIPGPWDPRQPSLENCTVRGQREYRAILHLHSPHSHDACDNDPQPGGVFNEPCLADQRAGLCATRIDVAFLSDHPAYAEDATIEAMALIRGDDEPITNAMGEVVGNWLRCDDGHKVLLLPGIESGEMMPFALERHAPEGTYGESSPASFQAIADAGGVKWVAHTEQRMADELAPLGLDGLEFYQLHANLDPDIRQDYLGLDPSGFLTDVMPFFFPTGAGAEPDLAPLGFLLPNEPSMATFEALGQTQRLTISAGTDAHENVLPTKVADGERIDSYRRMMRWFNNRLKVQGALSPETARAALRSGQNHIVFESLGTPYGFDFYAEQGGAVAAENGAEVKLGPGLEIVATVPTLDPRSPRSDEAPLTRAALIRAGANGRETLIEWTAGELRYEIDAPGVYRVEVYITPHHLAPYLGDYVDDLLDKELPWVYSGGIFVRP
ncbi:MAG: hypothetical protein R3B09_08030 [Nannocystaceae bacterium]